MSFEGKFLEN